MTTNVDVNKWVIENYDYIVHICKVLARKNGWYGSPEDLAQEVALRILQTKGNLEGTGHSFAFTIARNLISDQHRRRKNRRTAVNPVDLASIADPVKPPEYTPEDAQRIREYMKRLTPSQREIILMRAEGLSHKEISRLLDIPQNTVQTKLFRARNTLERQTAIKRKRNQPRKK